MLFIYIAIAAAGFAVAYIVKNFFLTNRSSTSTITNEKLQPTPVGWKTYTNADANVQFSYPPTDKLKASSFGFGITNIVLQTASGDADFQIILAPKTLAETIGQNFDNYYTLPNNTTKVVKSPLAKDNTTEKFTKIRNRSVNGLQSLDYQAIASDAKSGSQPEIGTFIVAGTNLVLFSTGKSTKTRLEQLISTVSYSP